jgi:hypothetical protein
VRLVLAKTLAPDVILASWAAGAIPTAEALGKLREVDSAAWGRNVTLHVSRCEGGRV